MFFRVNVSTRRLGGSYGGKISRSTLVAVACAIAATELSKPVRIALDLDTNMALVGGRLPYYCKYKVLIVFTTNRCLYEYDNSISVDEEGGN